MHKILLSFVIGIAVTMLGVALMVIFASPKFIVDGVNNERNDFAQVVGVKNVTNVVNETEEMFQSTQSAREWSESVFVVEKNKDLEVLEEKNAAIGGAAYWVRDAFQNLHDTIWNMVYQTFQRVSFVMLLLPLLLFIALPAIVDGFMTREIKKQTMGYTSPYKYNVGFLGSVSLLFVFLFMLMAPFDIPVIAYFLWTILFALATWIATAHLLKKF